MCYGKPCGHKSRSTLRPYSQLVVIIESNSIHHFCSCCFKTRLWFCKLSHPVVCRSLTCNSLISTTNTSRVDLYAYTCVRGRTTCCCCTVLATGLYFARDAVDQRSSYV